MKYLIFSLVGLILLNTAYTQELDSYSLNEIIVKFKTTSDVIFDIGLLKKSYEHSLLDSLNIQYGMINIKHIGNRKKKDTYVFSFQKNQDIKTLVDIYSSTNLFEFVEPNFIGKGGGERGSIVTIPNDFFFTRQWGLVNNGNFTLSAAKFDADIDMELAWEIEQGDTSVLVAILDSGLKLDHPDINKRVWINRNEIANGIDDDNNAYINDFNGWNFVVQSNDVTDDNGHGTNVAGIVGADANNTIGYAGVDWNCKLMIGKILDQDNKGFYSWWTEAIYYAVDNGAKVINMSVGGTNFSISMMDAADYAYNNGVTIVACMMNNNNSVVQYPAGYVNTIAVGSTNPNDYRSVPFYWSPSSGSNYGNHIDVVAPGNFIYGLDYVSNTNYNGYWGGTSQATPLVTGLCALLFAQDTNRTPDQIRTILQTTSEDMVGNPSEDIPGFDIYFGYGRINAHQALLQKSVGINEDFQNRKSTVSPNPTTGVITYETNEITGKVIVKDILGNIVFEVNNSFNQNVITIDISLLPSGVYLLIATDNDGRFIHSQKVIKQ